MGRLCSLAMVALLLCGTFVLVGAGIDRDDSGRSMLGVSKDSTSTLEIGDLIGQFPTDTAAVPLYLHTDSIVTYIEARIYWEKSDLELISVVPGPGIPGTAALDTLMPNDSTVIVQISNPGDPFGIPSGEAIAYLNFEIQCFGYGASTWIRFVDDDNYNVYVSNGVLRSPLRDDGRLWTEYETYLFLYGYYTYAYAGEQDIPVVIQLYQEIPGKLLSVNYLYDMDYLHFDSVTLGEGLMPGDTVYAEVIDDTIKITLPETNEFLPAGQHHLFTLHFGAETDEDDYTTYVSSLSAVRLDECGGLKTPTHWGPNIIVENHTATADIGEVSYYTTATTYDVWVKMGSNYPVNDYELWVAYPKDTLAFGGIVSYGEFLRPLAALSGDSTKILISADIGTNYPPSSPTIVFKIRFNRLFELPAWTVIPIKFYETPQNHISYDMDDPFGYHQADLTLLDGKITIKPVPPPPPPPACPALYIWNGSGFERENTILAACDGKVVQNDVTDYYLVSKRMQADSDLLRFQIREDGEENSTFSDFRLLVVDHPNDKPIQVTREGKIVTIGQPHSIIWAKDSKGNDITELIATKDEVPYIGPDGGWFEVSFGKLSAEEIEGFTALTATKPKDEEEESSASGSTTRAPLGTSQPKDTKLNVSLKMADGSWQLISSEDARLEPATQATLIDPALVSPDHELVLRYSWDGYYEIDVLNFATVEPFEGEPKEMRLSSASHSAAGAFLDRLGIGNEPVTLVTGEVIDLAFTVSSVPPYAKGTKRDYIFVTTGRYHKEGEETPRAEFALDANFPNPFNPSTTICYNLPRPTYVELRIYDVRGALVRTLVAGHQGAGEKSVTWDGRLDSGAMASSGVYFYQLKTSEFNRTRKMVLLK